MTRAMKYLKWGQDMWRKDLIKSRLSGKPEEKMSELRTDQ